MVKAATIHEIKQELLNVPAPRLIELCLRLAKYKKENKELLTYLLFESYDEQAYIRMIKQEIDQQFEALNLSNLYFAKKGLRKIARIITKHVRYAASRQAEVEWLLYFCTKLKASGIPIQRNTVIANLYNSQIKKINQALATMHEDLQYEYERELKSLL